MRNKIAAVLGVFVLAVAATAFAISHSFSGTINTPAVLTWVDSSENQIAPFSVVGISWGPAYLDTSTGYLWELTACPSSH